MIIVLNLKTYAEGELSQNPPNNLIALVDDLDESSLPTLYITRSDSKSVRDVSEEYVFPIDFLKSDMSTGVSAAYYREFRNEQGIEKNWEFMRSVYLEYFSPASR